MGERAVGRWQWEGGGMGKSAVGRGGMKERARVGVGVREGKREGRWEWQVVVRWRMDGEGMEEERGRMRVEEIGGNEDREEKRGGGERQLVTGGRRMEKRVE